jgi:glycosyltransferase involved in cell wall biosynthesis
MRVIYSIGSKFAGGGIGRTAYHAVRGLHRHGMLHRLLCSSYRPTEIPATLIRRMGVISRGLRRIAIYDTSDRITHFHNWIYDTWAARHLEPVDLFHVWGNYGLVCLQQAKVYGAITIVERASSHPFTQRTIMQEEYARWGLAPNHSQASIRRSLKEIERADYVLIPSDFVRQSFLKHGVSEKKLIQIPFGVDVHHFRPADNARKKKAFRVLFVGQVSLQKGVAYLLEAWRTLRWQDVELWLVGRASPQMRSLLQRYKLDTIRQLGYVSDPAAIYQQADVFAFPSLQEGSALVTYEALATGLPVITTPNAGSVVRDGVEGFIIPIQDAEALVAALERLRTDERLRAQMGRAARSRARAFTWEHYGDAVAEAYRERATILGKRTFSK